MGKRNCVDQLDLFNDAVPTCVVDGKPLTGRQTRYCSKACAQRAAYEWQKASGYRTTGSGYAKRKAWMDANRDRLNQRALKELTCLKCGRSYMTKVLSQKFCSRTCAGAAIRIDRPPRQPHETTQPGPIRQAIECEDWPTLIDLLRERTTLSSAGCWEWKANTDRDGYPKVTIYSKKHRGGGGASTHRVMAMAMTGRPVPSHLHVHHKCANRSCINPAHLQVVEPHENTAEMLERQSYLRRIAELEAELEAVRAKPA